MHVLLENLGKCFAVTIHLPFQDTMTSNLNLFQPLRLLLWRQPVQGERRPSRLPVELGTTSGNPSQAFQFEKNRSRVFPGKYFQWKNTQIVTQKMKLMIMMKLMSFSIVNRLTRPTISSTSRRVEFETRYTQNSLLWNCLTWFTQVADLRLTHWKRRGWRRSGSTATSPTLSTWCDWTPSPEEPSTIFRSIRSFRGFWRTTIQIRFSFLLQNSSTLIFTFLQSLKKLCSDHHPKLHSQFLKS